MPPSVLPGLATGLLIAIIDTAALVAPGPLGVSGETVQLVDLVANVVLYSYLGLRVGRATGVVRDAAEAGVIAALVAATIGVAISLSLGAEQGSSLVQNTVGTYAMNVAMGGVLAIVNGWLGTKARQSGSPRRP